MTIAIISKNVPLIPLATENAFHTYWKPAAEEMGLEWLPLFEYGICVEKIFFPEIIKEIQLFREWIVRQDINVDEQNHLLTRIDFILQSFHQQLIWEDELYFG